MPRRRKRTASLGKAVELSILAPQIIALRSLRLHDHGELNRMGTEKVLAFWESMNAMALQATKAQQEYALFAMRQWWSPWISPAAMAACAASIFEKGIAPIHKRAAANARRLSRGRRRSASTG
jgi:hypothetical protein